MSQRNGDKARFERERQKKMVRREHTQAARKALSVKTEQSSIPILTPNDPKATD